MALSPNEAFYLEATEESAFDILRILKSETVEKVGINLKFDMVVALNIAEKLAAPYYDVAIAHYLLQPEMSHSINRLAEIYLKKKILPDYQLPATAKANKFNPALSLRNRRICKVACARAAACLELKPMFDKKLEEEKMAHLLHDIELPLVEVLATWSTLRAHRHRRPCRLLQSPDSASCRHRAGMHRPCGNTVQRGLAGTGGRSAVRQTENRRESEKN